MIEKISKSIPCEGVQPCICVVPVPSVIDSRLNKKSLSAYTQESESGKVKHQIVLEKKKKW